MEINIVRKSEILKFGDQLSAIHRSINKYSIGTNQWSVRSNAVATHVSMGQRFHSRRVYIYQRLMAHCPPVDMRTTHLANHIQLFRLTINTEGMWPPVPFSRYKDYGFLT